MWITRSYPHPRAIKDNKKKALNSVRNNHSYNITFITRAFKVEKINDVAVLRTFARHQKHRIINSAIIYPVTVFQIVVVNFINILFICPFKPILRFVRLFNNLQKDLKDTIFF